MLSVVAALAVAAGCLPTPTEEGAYLASAAGLDALARGDPERAIGCFEQAVAHFPDSAVLWRDLALAFSQQQRWSEAEAALEKAEALGDPGAALVGAVVAAELGAPDAISKARAAGGVEGDSIGAALGDESARRSLVARSASPEGALVRLVLAARSAARGQVGPARGLAAAAARQAEAGGDGLTLEAARQIEAGLDETSPVEARFSARLEAEAIENPLVATSPDRAAGVRARIEAAAVARWGDATIHGSAVVDQRLFFEDRARAAEWTGVGAAAAVAVPLGDDPGAAELEVGLRVLDLRADRLGSRVGTQVEGGPSLRLAVAPSWWTELGVYGVWTEFGGQAPRNFERDRIGQRARLALRYRDRALRGSMELVGLHDETTGRAFDAVGAGAGCQLEAQATERLAVFGGLSAMLRRFGPFGDEAVIGEAERRGELRIATELGARFWLGSGLHLAARHAWVRTDARTAPQFGTSQFGAGVEATW